MSTFRQNSRGARLAKPLPMVRRSSWAGSVAEDGAAEAEQDFAWAAQFAIVRRAVANLWILGDLPDTKPSVLRGDLIRLCTLSETLISALATTDLASDTGLGEGCSNALLAVRDVRRRLSLMPIRTASRPAMEMIRRRLYMVLASLSEQLAGLEVIDVARGELDQALFMRQLVSDFRGAMVAVVRGRTNLSWSLIVARSELGILLQEPGMSAGPARERTQLLALHRRLARSSGTRLDQAKKSRLHADVLETSSLLVSLSRRPDVKRHDGRALGSLALLLSRGRFSMAVAAGAVESLAVLRGMDPVLDRLMLEVPFDPQRLLAIIARRVSELRAQALAS